MVPARPRPPRQWSSTSKPSRSRFRMDSPVAFQACSKSCSGASPSGIGCLNASVSWLAARVLEQLAPGLRRQPGTLVFLPWLDRRAVGVAVCMTGFSTFTAKPLINIHDLAVTADYRGRGVGRLLLKAVEAKARELGCGKVTLEVHEDNAPAQQLYQRFGFRDGEDDLATFFMVKTPSCAKTRPFRNRPQISSLDALGIRAESRVFRAAGLTSDPWAGG